MPARTYLRRGAAALLPLLWASCAGVAPREGILRPGERLEAAGRTAEALKAYQAASRRCTEDRPECRQSRQRAAELLVRLGRVRQAQRAYAELLAWTRDAATAGRAADRSAELLERQGRLAEAIALSQRIMRRFPEEVAAEDALRRCVRLLSAPQQQGRLVELLLALYRDLGRTAIGDNLLYAAASVYQRKGRKREAIALYDQLAARYKRSPLRDDALWRAGQLSETLGDHEGALRRYRRLLATRRDAWFMGSYNSEHLDDAQLRVGLIHLERKEVDAALRALEELRDGFTESLLRDDAEWWIAQIHKRAGRRELACQHLRQLEERFPSGNHVRRAREARTELGCGR